MRLFCQPHTPQFLTASPGLAVRFAGLNAASYRCTWLGVSTYLADHARHNRFIRHSHVLASQPSPNFKYAPTSLALSQLRLYSTQSNTPTNSPNTKSVSDPAPGSWAADWRIIKELVSYIWPSPDPAKPLHHVNVKVRVIAALSLLIVGKLLNVSVPMVFKHIVDTLNVTISAAHPVVEASANAWWLSMLGEPSVTMTVVGSLVLGYGVARFGAVLSQELRNAVFGSVAQRAMRDAARSIFDTLVHLDMRFHLDRQTGGLVRAIDRGTKGIQSVLSSVVFNVVPTIFEISLVCGLLGAQFGWEYAAVTVATMAAYSGFTILTTAWRTKFRRQMNAADNQAATTATDTLLNIEAVKHFNNESVELSRYDKALAKYESASLKTISSLAFLNAGQNFVISSALTAVMYMASTGVVDGSMTLGDLVMINGLLFQLSVPLNFLGMVYRETRQGLLDMDAMFRLRRTTPATLENHVTPSLLTPPKPLSLTHGGGDIELKDVWFSYATTTANSGSTNPSTPLEDHGTILRGVSLKIPASTTAALVGPSGCGKSTVLKLLFRFMDPSSGSVTIDGQDLRNVESGSLRRTVGVVPQDAILFNSTVRYNVGYGRVTASEAEVTDAARRALLLPSSDSSILLGKGARGLPNGLDTDVGERGLKISGGEKQRVLLARLFLKNSPICLFDEVSSALDQHTETLIHESVQDFLQSPPRQPQGVEVPTTGQPLKHTAVFVAHRLATIAHCDQIIVMKEGRVVETGTHDELLEIEGGVYASMWHAQQHVEENDETA